MKIKKFVRLLTAISLFGLSLSLNAATSTYVLEAETMSHGQGYADGKGWAVNVNLPNPGSHMVYGSTAQNLGEGGAQAVFKMKIDISEAFKTDTIAILDVYDKTNDEVLVERKVGRNEFQSGTYQDFPLPFSLKGRDNHTIEYRVWWGRTSYLNVDNITVTIDSFESGAPQLINKSGASDTHVDTLVAQAVSGLGFVPGDYSAPNKQDLIFVGKYYMAWIDQTGFFGKMNGLWLLNGEGNDTLDFIQFDGTRPFNFLAVGENGMGKWLENYTGAEHFEIPHIVKEGDDPDSCDEHLCNWYSVSEADAITGTGLPHWTACQDGKMSWAQYNAPATHIDSGAGLELAYQAAITKESDNDHNKADGDACHSHMLFSDGYRRPVYLNLGYRFHGDQPYFERTYQYENPATNSVSFGEAEIGGWSIIHGLLITKMRDGITEKLNLRNNLYLNEDTFKTKNPGQWYDINPGSITADDVWSWLGQAYTLSADQSYDAGKSIGLAHQGLYDNSDIGLCSCVVHGALEIGGGVLHGNAVKSVNAGQKSIKAVKRVAFPQGTSVPALTNDPLGSADYTTTVFNGKDLGHAIGVQDSNGWKVNTRSDNAGHMIYGPYQSFGTSTDARAVFKIKIDNNHANNEKVLTLDIYDATTGEIITAKDVYRKDFPHNNTFVDFVLPFELTGPSTNSLETRVYWWDNSAVTVKRVTVVTKN